MPSDRAPKLEPRIENEGKQKLEYELNQAIELLRNIQGDASTINTVDMQFRLKLQRLLAHLLTAKEGADHT